MTYIGVEDFGHIAQPYASAKAICWHSDKKKKKKTTRTPRYLCCLNPSERPENHGNEGARMFPCASPVNPALSLKALGIVGLAVCAYGREADGQDKHLALSRLSVARRSVGAEREEDAGI